MSRKGPAPKRAIIPDPRFKNLRLAKFMNMLMRGGKKGLAERIVYGALDVVSQRTGKDPLVVFQDAMENAMPLVEVRARRVGRRCQGKLRRRRQLRCVPRTSCDGLTVRRRRG